MLNLQLNHCIFRKYTFSISNAQIKTYPYLGECWVWFLATSRVPPTPPPTLGSFLIPPHNTMLVIYSKYHINNLYCII
ncbi:hypothetical protein Lal_00016956 [Lupinus albus]|nr:hypothetical protein Lal_00016956 [Lupinus albus]